MPLASSTEETTGSETKQVDEEQQTQNKSDTANSSAADEKGEKTTSEVLDEVLNASKPGEKAPDSEEDPESEDGEAESEEESDEKSKDKTKDEELSDDPTEEEINSYKPKTRKRVQQLLGQRNAYRDVGSVEEVKQFRDSHERFTQVIDYVNDAGLSNEDVTAGFNIMALMKNDPVKALEELRPIFHTLEQLAGEVLPDELVERVKQGEISEQDARELQRSKAREHLSEEAAERAARKADTVEKQTQQTTTQNEVRTAVSTWERNWQSKDPDYKAKQTRVSEKIENTVLRMTVGGKLPTAQEAVGIAQKALKEVNEEMKLLAPAKKDPIEGPAGGSAASDAHPEPKSTLDVLDLALRQTGAQ